jgi:hypothetical protein
MTEQQNDVQRPKTAKEIVETFLEETDLPILQFVRQAYRGENGIIRALAVFE